MYQVWYSLVLYALVGTNKTTRNLVGGAQSYACAVLAGATNPP